MQASKGPKVKIVSLGSSSKSSRVPHATDPTFIPKDNAQIRNLVALSLKVNHLISKHEYKVFVTHFLNKTIKPKYYMDKVVEKEIDIYFLQSFENHKLLKIIYLHINFNLNHVKAFYCHMEALSTSIHCQLSGMLIKFGIEDFKNVFGLENKKMEVCVSNPHCFNCA